MSTDTPEIGLELLQQVLDMTGMLVVILDRQGRILHFNQKTQQSTGFTDKQLLTKKMSEALLHGTQQDTFEQHFAQALAGKTRVYEAFWRTLERGKFLCVYNTISTFGSDSVSTPWVIVTGTDITEKKRVEQALLNSEAQLRAIHDAAVDGIITINEDGMIENLNRAAANMFGYLPEELIGQNVSVLMSSPDREQHDQYLANYLKTGVAKIIGKGREVTGRRKDGKTFPHYLAVSEVNFTAATSKRMFTGIVRDLSERNRIEQAAHLRLTEHAHASRLAALGEMASGIAHELNQPLAAIVSFADASKRILSSQNQRLEVIGDALDQIAQQGERAGNIIRRLREFVHKGEVDREQVEINQLVDDVLAILEHDLRLQQITVTCELESDLPKIYADKLQIEQVILNLVRNSIDAMEQSPQRKLTIRTKRDSDYIGVTVSDSGTGFTEDQVKQLFDAFFTTKPEGTGLGLSISHSIITAHGGVLTAASDSTGATFRFSLPVT